MSTFQILCVTMNQNDFSKIKQMNIHSNVIFANQTNINKKYIKNLLKKLTTSQPRMCF
mgnify:CR=1 FL=1